MSNHEATPKPTTLAVRPEAIPAEVTQLHRWVLWRWECRDNKWTKPPFSLDGKHASSTDPSTWSPFEAVLSAYRAGGWDGVGLVLTDDDDLAGLDLDHVGEKVEDAVVDEILASIASYAERSPSGTGVRVFQRAKLPAGARKRGPFEVYESGRYLTVTGHHIEGTPSTVEHRQEAVEAFCRRYLPAPQLASAAERASTSPDLSDHEVLELAFGAANGGKVRALYRGSDEDHRSDRSAGDLALCSLFAFYSQDATQLDRLFRGSDRVRSKWDARHAVAGTTYGQLTIDKALGGMRETYTPPRPKKTDRKVANGQAIDGEDHRDDGVLDHHVDDGGDGGDPGHLQEQRHLPAPNQPIAVARVLAAEQYSHPDAPLLRYWRGSFWRWVRSHWLEDEEAHLRSAAYRFTEHAAYVDLVGKEKVPTVKTWAPNRYKVADLLDALRAVSHLPETVDQPAWLDGHKGARPTEIVACSNGLLHVPTRELSAHTPRLFNRVAVPFPYDPEPASPARWLAFLDQLWPDDPAAIAALQEWFGYCISGRTDLHKILLLIGPTRAGKGVIARVLAALLGRGNVAGPTLASLGQNFGLQDLVGKPLAVIADARLGGANTHQVVERLLSISGEDMLTIDRKYRDPWTGKLPTRFVVISNELPRFGDASGAIARRFVVLTCHQSWLGRENPRLTEELLSEMPGILAWALDGVDSLRTNGKFTEPSSSTDAITTLLDTVSPTSAFVRDRCTIEAIHECPVDALYLAWRRWCEDNGIDKPGTKQTFGRNLRAVVPSLRVVRPRDGDDRERRYVGLTLRTGPQ